MGRESLLASNGLGTGMLAQTYNTGQPPRIKDDPAQVWTVARLTNPDLSQCSQNLPMHHVEATRMKPLRSAHLSLADHTPVTESSEPEFLRGDFKDI